MSEVSGFPHICDVCGRAAIWGPDWSVFGSYLDDERGASVKTCSARCKAAFEGNGRELPISKEALAAICAAQRTEIYASGRWDPPANDGRPVVTEPRQRPASAEPAR